MVINKYLIMYIVLQDFHKLRYSNPWLILHSLFKNITHHLRLHALFGVCPQTPSTPDKFCRDRCYKPSESVVATNT